MTPSGIPNCTCTPQQICSFCAEYLPSNQKALLCPGCGSPQPPPIFRAEALVQAHDRARALQKLGLGEHKVCPQCCSVLLEK